MIPSPTELLLVASALLGALYVFLFFRLLAREPDKRAMIVRPRWLIGNAGLLFGLVFFAMAPRPFLDEVVMVLPLSLFYSVNQYRDLVRQGAGPVFIKRWGRTTGLSYVAYLAFLGALYLGT